MLRKFILCRDVFKSECPWLDDDMKKETVVYQYYGATYGCVSGAGRAVTLVPDKTPFFELPRDALEEIAALLRAKFSEQGEGS